MNQQWFSCFYFKDCESCHKFTSAFTYQHHDLLFFEVLILFDVLFCPFPFRHFLLIPLWVAK